METSKTRLIRPLTPAVILDDQNGFTLIEILVTGIILSVIVSLSFFSLNVYMNEWEQGRLEDISAIEQLRTRQLIRRALESVEEYIITDPLAEREGDFYPHFNGTAQSTAFVTAAPVFGKSLIAAARIRLEPATDHSHTILVYEEAPFDRFYLRYGDDPIPYSYSITLPLSEPNLKFRYYGLLEFKFLPDENRLEEILGWQDAFDGRQKQVTPHQIEIVRSNDPQSALISFDIKSMNRSKLIYYEFNL